MYRHFNELAYHKSASVLGLLLALVLMHDFHVDKTRLLSTILSCGATGFFLADRHWVDATMSTSSAARLMWQHRVGSCRRRSRVDNSVDIPMNIVNPRKSSASFSAGTAPAASECRRRSRVDNSVDIPVNIVNPRKSNASFSACTAPTASESSKAEHSEDQAWYVVLPLVSSSQPPVLCEVSS